MNLKSLATIAALSGLAFGGPEGPGSIIPPSFVDIDGDHVISAEELAGFVKARKDAAKGLADRADANGDGEVDEEERQNMIAAIHANVEERRCALFEAVAGEDGLMDYDEFRETHPVNKLPTMVARRLFGYLDTSGAGDEGDEPDGFVNKEEFLASLRMPGGPNAPDGPGPDLPNVPDLP